MRLAEALFMLLAGGETLKLNVIGIDDGQMIPPVHVFCIVDPQTHATFGANRNPALVWDDVPEGTESFVVLCWDRTVPTIGEDVNQEGREIPLDLPRTDFFHWVLVDIPGHDVDLDEGEFSQEVTPRGKDGGRGPRDTRQGLNDYTGWFFGDADMEGLYYGYDGPCPPWNDSLVHEYVFTVYALDIARCSVSGDFTGSEVRDAIELHVLAEASVVGRYTLNPRLINEG